MGSSSALFDHRTVDEGGVENVITDGRAHRTALAESGRGGGSVQVSTAATAAADADAAPAIAEVAAEDTDTVGVRTERPCDRIADNCAHPL